MSGPGPRQVSYSTDLAQELHNALRRAAQAESEARSWEARARRAEAQVAADKARKANYRLRIKELRAEVSALVADMQRSAGPKPRTKHRMTPVTPGLYGGPEGLQKAVDELYGKRT